MGCKTWVINGAWCMYAIDSVMSDIVSLKPVIFICTFLHFHLTVIDFDITVCLFFTAPNTNKTTTTKQQKKAATYWTPLTMFPSYANHCFISLNATVAPCEADWGLPGVPRGHWMSAGVIRLWGTKAIAIGRRWQQGLSHAETACLSLWSRWRCLHGSELQQSGSALSCSRSASSVNQA